MTLLDQIARMRYEPDDRDLLEFFGIKPGDPLQITGDGVTVGTETVSLADARRALLGPPSPPARTVEIADLSP